MRMDILSLYSGLDSAFGTFTVFDEAMSKIIEDVMWVDDASMEVAVISSPPRVVGFEIVTDLIPVASVSVDYPAERITVNTCLGAKVLLAPVKDVTDKPPVACDACCQPQTCERICYCAAYRCGFGEVDKP